MCRARGNGKKPDTAVSPCAAHHVRCLRQCGRAIVAQLGSKELSKTQGKKKERKKQQQKNRTNKDNTQQPQIYGTLASFKLRTKQPFDQLYFHKFLCGIITILGEAYMNYREREREKKSLSLKKCMLTDFAVYKTNVQSNEVKRTERLLFDSVYKYCATVQFLKSSTITVWLVRRNLFDAVAFFTFSRVCTHAHICHII